MLADETGLPVDFRITAGQAAEYAQAILLLEGQQAEAVIPPKRNRKLQREYDKDLYKQRNRIERCFSKLKCFRRFATRYEKSKTCFKALVALACAWVHLKLYVDTA